MKSNKLRHIGVSLAVLALVLPALLSVSSAQDSFGGELFEPAEKDKEPLTCELEGSRNWGDFLSATVAYDGVVEYWVDIFGRNRCQSLDVDNILGQLKRVRQQIRAAFYTCDENRANVLGKRYNELLTELYYVRKIVIGADPKNPQSKIVVPNPGLYAEMKKRFVTEKSYFATPEFDKLFVAFEDKYASKKGQQKGSYLNCNDPIADELAAKWEEFQENLGGLKSGAEAAKKPIERAAKRYKNTPAGNMGNMLGGYLDFKINETEPKAALEQILDSTIRDIPFADTLGVTHAELVKGEIEERQRYESSLIRAKKQGEILFKYQQNTDSIREAFEKKLKNTNTTLKETFKPLNRMTKCVSTVYTRQCK